MSKRINQSGFGHIAAAFVIVFVAIVGFAGYKVWTFNHTPVADTASTVPAAVVPAKINNKSDLSQAGKQLDSSTTDVNNNLNDNGLNNDLNDML